MLDDDDDDDDECITRSLHATLSVTTGSCSVARICGCLFFKRFTANDCFFFVSADYTALY